MPLLRRTHRHAEGRLRRRLALEFYPRFVRPGSLCFDVGANRGERTAVFLELGATVVAVEPHPGCVRELNERYGRSDRVIVLPVGLAESPGVRTMRLAEATTLSSMSDKFIERTQNTGRFSNFSWSSETTVRVTTLEHMIAVFGTPDFCKIDVEGYEGAVLRPLTTPIPALSFEVAAELVDEACDCIDLLQRLGDYRFAYSPEETFRQLWEGASAAEAKNQLAELADGDQFGDVYATIID